MRPAHTVFAKGGGTRPCASQFCLLTAVAIMSSVQLGILSGADQTTPEAPPQAANHVLTILDGTQARVRLAQTLNTRLVRSGDSFSAVLDETVTLRDSIVLPKGTPFLGGVLESKRSGAFRGRARLDLTLLSFRLNGMNYRIQSAADSEISGPHKKRDLALVAGGTGTGVAAGGLAGGLGGALIGAGAGAVAGTTTALFAGRKNVELPVETPLVFSLKSGVAVPQA